MSDRSAQADDPFFWSQRDVEFDLAIAAFCREAAAAAEQQAARVDLSDAVKLALRVQAAGDAERADWFSLRAATVSRLMADDVSREVPAPAGWAPIAAMLQPRRELVLIEGPYARRTISVGVPAPGVPLPAYWLFRCENGDDVFWFGFANEAPTAPGIGKLLGRYAYDDGFDSYMWLEPDERMPDPASPSA